MSVVIIGGHDRMVCQYKQICKQFKCKAKVFTQMSAAMSKQIGSPDLIVLFTNTVSHKMVRCAVEEAGRCNSEVVRCLSLIHIYTITVRLFSVCDNVLRRKGVEKLSSAADDSTVIIQFVNRFKEEQSSFMYVCDIVGNFIQTACDMGRNKDGMVFLLCKFS